MDAERILRFPDAPVDKSSKKLCILNDDVTIAEIRKAIESIRNPAPQIFKFVRQLAITPTSSPVASPVSSPIPSPQKSITGLAVSKRRSICYDSIDTSKLLAGFKVDKYINSSNYQEIWSDGTLLSTYSLTHSLTYLLTHSLTYLLTYLLTHSRTYLLTYLLTHMLSLRCVSPIHKSQYSSRL